MVEQWQYQSAQICGSTKSRFIKNQEAKGKFLAKKQKDLFRKLGIKTPLSKVSILGDILF